MELSKLARRVMAGAACKRGGHYGTCSLQARKRADVNYAPHLRYQQQPHRGIYLSRGVSERGVSFAIRTTYERIERTGS